MKLSDLRGDRLSFVLGRLKTSRFFRAIVTLTSANAFGQLIMLAAMPFLTRLYTPDAFGVLAVFASVMGVVLVVSSLRYELAIPLPASDRNSTQIVLMALIINLMAVLVVSVFVVFFRHDVARWTQTPLMASYLWLLPLAILSGGTYKVLNYWAIRHRDYRKIAITKLTQSVSNVSAQILGGLLGLGALGLILGQIVGQSVGISRLAKGIRFKGLFTASSGKRTRVLMSRYSKFAKYDTPAAAVNAASSQLPNIAMALIFGPGAAGLYFLADRILAVPLSMVSQAAGQVLFGQAREDMRLGTLTRRMAGLALGLTVIVACVAVLVFFLSEPVFVFIFGEEWREAGVIASWLIIGLAVQFIFNPLSVVLMATEGQLANLLIHSFILTAKLLAFYLASISGSQLDAVHNLVWSLVAGYGFGLIVVFLRAHFYSGSLNA